VAAGRRGDRCSAAWGEIDVTAAGIEWGGGEQARNRMAAAASRSGTGRRRLISFIHRDLARDWLNPHLLRPLLPPRLVSFHPRSSVLAMEDADQVAAQHGAKICSGLVFPPLYVSSTPSLSIPTLVSAMMNGGGRLQGTE
jgi:hypothetical protein